jgi:hypothetical protein
MSVFDQRGQHVNYQYNINNSINLDTVRSKEDLVVELQKIKTEIALAGDSNAIESEAVTEAQYQLQKAIDQSTKPVPDKKAVIEYLSTAKDVVKGFVAASGLVTGIAKAIDIIQSLF